MVGQRNSAYRPYNMRRLAHFPDPKLEMQIEEILKYSTADGGYAIELINDTGEFSVRGTVVQASTNVDGGFQVAGADSAIPIGIVYDSDVAHGSLCRVIVSGQADVLLKDDTPAIRGNWVGVSDVAGRAWAGGGIHPGTNPPAQAEHNRELGHCLQSVTAGTNKLARIVLHFN